MGQDPVPPVNIPIPTKIGSKMGGAPTPKWDPIGLDPQPVGISSFGRFWSPGSALQEANAVISAQKVGFDVDIEAKKQEARALCLHGVTT